MVLSELPEAEGVRVGLMLRVAPVGRSPYGYIESVPDRCRDAGTRSPVAPIDSFLGTHSNSDSRQSARMCPTQQSLVPAQPGRWA
jgi:hypothetical protein